MNPSTLNLPLPAQLALLLEMPLDSVLSYCGTSASTLRQCRDNHEVWLQRIKNECPNYKIEIKPEEAYNKWLDCQNSKKINITYKLRYSNKFITDEKYWFNLFDLLNQNILEVGYVLCHAIFHDKLKLVKYLINNEKSRDIGLRYFDSAAYYNKVNSMIIINDKFHFTKEELNTITNFTSPLITACKNNNLDAVKYILETYDFNLSDQFIYSIGYNLYLYDSVLISALYESCSNYSINVAKYLINKYDYPIDIINSNPQLFACYHKFKLGSRKFK